MKTAAVLASAALLGASALADQPPPAPRSYQPKPAPSYKEPSYEEPAKYAFDWQVKDDYSGNDFGQQEQRDGDATSGSYYVQLPDGRLQTVTYRVNGYGGYEAEVTYEGEAKYEQAASSYKPSYQPAPKSYKPEPKYKPAEPKYKPEPKPEPKYKPAPKPEPKYRPAPAYKPEPEPKYKPAEPQYKPAPEPKYKPAEPKYKPAPTPAAPGKVYYKPVESKAAPKPKFYYKKSAYKL